MRIVLESRKLKSVVGDLLPREAKAFISLALVANNGKVVHTRWDGISEQTGFCEVTLRRAIRGLHDKGILKIESQGIGPGAEMELSFSGAWIKFEEK